MRWAIVADDLTGAADAAVVFADRGISTTVWLCEPRKFPDGTCCSVDANARWRDAKSAAEAIGKHIGKLLTANWLMLKIDSTLRGFVGSMVQAAWQASGRKWALIIPAVPKQGRKVINGKLFVHGQLVTEIDLAKEKPAPVTTPFVAERLRSTGLDKFSLENLTLEVVRQRNLLVQAIERAAADGLGLICDAETEKDLERIVSVAVKLPNQPLFVGASGLANALAKVTGKNSIKRRASLEFHPNRILVVVGSQQVVARKQVEFLAEEGVPVFEVKGENLPNLLKAKVSAVLLEPNWILSLSPHPQKRCQTVAKFRRWLKSSAADALIIVGGLTARAVFEAFGTSNWDLFGSLASGVPFGIARFCGRRLLVATKAGGFGTEKTLWQVVRKLQVCSKSLSKQTSYE